MELWTSGITLLGYFMIPFVASESPQHTSLSHEAGKSDVPADLTDGCPCSPVSPAITFLHTDSLHRADGYPSLLIPIKMSTTDTSYLNSLETPCSTALWPKATSQRQQERSQALTVVVYDGRGSRHLGSLDEKLFVH